MNRRKPNILRMMHPGRRAAIGWIWVAALVYFPSATISVAQENVRQNLYTADLDGWWYEGYTVPWNGLGERDVCNLTYTTGPERAAAFSLVRLPTMEGFHLTLSHEAWEEASIPEDATFNVTFPETGSTWFFPNADKLQSDDTLPVRLLGYFESGDAWYETIERFQTELSVSSTARIDFSGSFAASWKFDLPHSTVVALAMLKNCSNQSSGNSVMEPEADLPAEMPETASPANNEASTRTETHSSISTFRTIGERQHNAWLMYEGLSVNGDNYICLLIYDHPEYGGASGDQQISILSSTKIGNSIEVRVGHTEWQIPDDVSFVFSINFPDVADDFWLFSDAYRSHEHDAVISSFSSNSKFTGISSFPIFADEFVRSRTMTVRMLNSSEPDWTIPLVGSASAMMDWADCVSRKQEHEETQGPAIPWR